MLSWLQRNAVLVLLRNETASVKQMRPPDVEANVFAYHLEGLQSDGFIRKVGRGTYALSAKGLRLAGSFSTQTNSQSEYIKTVVLLYAKQGDSYLMFRWSRQPYINNVSLVQDHMPLGKSLRDGIKSALTDKLGAEPEAAYVANALVTITHGGDIVTHMNALVYRVDIGNVALPYVSRNGTAFMGKPDGPGTMAGITGFLDGIEHAKGPFDVTLSY